MGMAALVFGCGYRTRPHSHGSERAGPPTHNTRMVKNTKNARVPPPGSPREAPCKRWEVGVWMGPAGGRSNLGDGGYLMSRLEMLTTSSSDEFRHPLWAPNISHNLATLMRTNICVQVTRAGQSSFVRRPVGLSFDEESSYETALVKVLDFGANAIDQQVKVIECTTAAQ